MNSKVQISCTIVTYNEDPLVLSKAIESFLSTPISKKLFIVDNSPSNSLRRLCSHQDVEYIHSKKNIGFARGNNSVKNKIKNLSDYHLVLNPDVHFNQNVIPKLITELNKLNEVALLTPKIIFPNQKKQYNVRKYPSFFNLVYRKLNIFKHKVANNEYRNLNLDESFFPDVIHGCFMLFKTDDYIKIGGFDERYFLYMEDVDICKKIDLIGKKKLYYPEVTITHVLKQGSSKSIKLFLYHLSSAIKYFVKWNIFPPKNKVNS